MPDSFLPSTYIERVLTICHILNWTLGIKQRTRKERTGRKLRPAQPCSPEGIRGREGKAVQVAGGRRVLRVKSKFVSGGRGEPEKAYLTSMCMKYYIVPLWDPVSTIYYNVSVGKRVSIWVARETSSYNSLGGVCNRFKIWGVKVGMRVEIMTLWGEKQLENTRPQTGISGDDVILRALLGTWWGKKVVMANGRLGVMLQSQVWILEIINIAITFQLKIALIPTEASL